MISVVVYSSTLALTRANTPGVAGGAGIETADARERITSPGTQSAGWTPQGKVPALTKVNRGAVRSSMAERPQRGRGARFKSWPDRYRKWFVDDTQVVGTPDQGV